MILTRTQVTELSGYRKPSCHIKWLKRQGLRVQNACPIWCGFHAYITLGGYGEAK